jgi:Holliday junction DNA helicase RuvA
MVQAVTATSVVVDVGGVGMRVNSTPRTLAEVRVGHPTRLYTELVVREDSLTLFGFAAEAEREAFATLQSVSGVGPRLALAMLAVHSPAELAAAVAAGDRAALERVPGVGAKVAARLLLELGGKLSLPDSDGAPARAGDGRGAVVEALTGLGWAAKAAEAVVAQVAPGPVSQDDVPETLRRALQEFGAGRG